MSAMIDAIAMDATSLYFTCEDGWVYRLDKTGGGSPRPLASFPGSFAWGIALDDAYVYWTAMVDGVSSGVVESVPKAGGTVSTLAAAQFRPWGIAVDDAAVFWVVQGAPAHSNGTGLAPGAVQAITKGGGGSPRVLAADVTAGDTIALDADAVVWHESRAIRRVGKTGGAPSTLLGMNVPFAASNLVLAGGRLLFAFNGGTWAIGSIPAGGGGSATLVSDIPQPAAVAVDGSTLFWSDVGGDGVGAIRGVPVTGGDVTTLWPPDDVGGGGSRGTSALLVDTGAFYSVEYEAEPALAVTIRVLPR
jgi:hypothetical protein